MENAILKRMMEDEPEKKEDAQEESGAPDEDKAMGMMKKEMIVKFADIITARLTIDLKKIMERLEGIANT
eukprot:1935644-Heterocapsa_arctica.AAC.1